MSKSRAARVEGINDPSKTKQRYIKSPEELWDLFTDYVNDTKANPIIVKDWVGGMAKEVLREKECPLTMDGFELHVAKKDVIKTMQHIFDNVSDSYNDFISICSRIKKSIREDQIRGGMVGIYSHSITARLNGLTEKIQEDGTKEVIIKVKYERKGNTDNAE